MMDITGLSLGLTSVDTKSQVSIAMLDKNLETNEKLGNSLVSMMNKSLMERSVNQNVGTQIDLYI